MLAAIGRVLERPITEFAVVGSETRVNVLVGKELILTGETLLTHEALERHFRKGCVVN